jgi:hypothetical protein
MNRTQALPYDDTPTGHSFAAAWRVIWIFSVPAAALVLGLIGEAAIYNLFG